MKNPPILISVIGFFAAVAGVSWIVLGARLLGFDWFGALGDLPKFEHTGLWGWFALAAGIAWIAVAVGLWTLQSWAWIATIVVAGVALFEAFLWFLEYPGTGVGIGMSVLPVIVLIYLNTATVKESFGLDDRARDDRARAR